MFAGVRHSSQDDVIRWLETNKALYDSLFLEQPIFRLVALFSTIFIFSKKNEIGGVTLIDLPPVGGLKDFLS